MEEISFSEFINLRNFIYESTGIFFEEKKIYFIKKRVEKRLIELNLDSAATYLRMLKTSRESSKELQTLTNLLTTNETYFFREYDQLAVFGEHCLTEIIEDKKKKFVRNLNIWCAGCSTGEEAYTLSIILQEMLPNLTYWNIIIYATDIDTEVLQKAKVGLYSDRSVKDVPQEYLEKYFTSEGDEWKVSEQVKKYVKFLNINLIDDFKMRAFKSIDFIFCRNVLIYFDEASRKRVVGNFFESLNKGGYIFLGHSESVSRISTAFTTKRKGDLIVYQKTEV